MSAGDTGLKTGKFLGLSSVKKARWGEHDQENIFFSSGDFYPRLESRSGRGKLTCGQGEHSTVLSQTQKKVPSERKIFAKSTVRAND